MNNGNTTTGQERTQGIAPFLFMSEAVRKGKKANNPTKQINQPTKPKKQQSKQGRKPREASHESRTKELKQEQRDKIEANTPQVI